MPDSVIPLSVMPKYVIPGSPSPKDRQTRRTTCQRFCLGPLLGVASFKRQNCTTTPFICLSHYPYSYLCQNVPPTVKGLDRGMGWSNERILQNVPDKKPEIRRLRSLWKERERAKKKPNFPASRHSRVKREKGRARRHTETDTKAEGRKGLKASFDCFIMIRERASYK